MVTRKKQSFILKVKLRLLTEAVLLHLSCFWLLGCWNIALFRTVPWLAWSPGQIHPEGDFFAKKTCSTIKRFFFFKYVLYYTVLSKYLKINVKVTVLEEKKVEIISLSSLVWGKSLTFYTCRAHVRALMKRKSCVRRNAILRNYLNLLNLAIFLKIANLKCTKIKCR